MTNEELLVFLSNLTVIQACKLALDLEDAWGVRRAGQPPIDTRMPAPAYGAPMPPSYGRDPVIPRMPVHPSYWRERAAPSDPDPLYTVYLSHVGPKPIHVMACVRAHLGWDLNQTKTALKAPRVELLKTDDWDKKKALVDDLEALGAKVEVV